MKKALESLLTSHFIHDILLIVAQTERGKRKRKCHKNILTKNRRYVTLFKSQQGDNMFFEN